MGADNTAPYEWIDAKKAASKPYSRFCFIRHLSRDPCGSRWQLQGALPLRRESLRVEGIPPALLSVGHSPSRRSYLRRWWALTPPVRSCPTGEWEDMLSVAVVVTRQLLGACPHLLFREATLPSPWAELRVGKFLSRARARERRIVCLPDR